MPSRLAGDRQKPQLENPGPGWNCRKAGFERTPVKKFDTRRLAPIRTAPWILASLVVFGHEVGIVNSQRRELASDGGVPIIDPRSELIQACMNGGW